MERAAELILVLETSITTYQAERQNILEKAYKEGGVELLIQTEDAYSEMQNALWELERKEIQRTQARYKDLVTKAGVIAANIKKSIDQLKNVTDVVNFFSELVALVGRALVLL